MRRGIGDNIERIVIGIGIVPKHGRLTVPLKGGSTATAVRWM